MFWSNGVGVWPLVPVDELSPEKWNHFMDINLNSAYSVTWSCIGGLREASGAVVNIASAIALKGHEQMVHYAAAKAGMIGMTRSLARALGPDSVRVNAVAPGLVATGRAVESWGNEGAAAFRATRALPIDITTHDVVEAVRFLASPAARAITGQTLVVDGGTVMH
jgi:NAD(P)-dependent dehydrogenase (short-subunit alcohol dehydrogenase family)